MAVAFGITHLSLPGEAISLDPIPLDISFLLALLPMDARMLIDHENRNTCGIMNCCDLQIVASFKQRCQRKT